MKATLGIAKAVTEAVKHNSDNWLLYMPAQPGKPGRFSPHRKVISTATETSLQGATHDRMDAAIMRLCLDDNDEIRRIYREGL